MDRKDRIKYVLAEILREIEANRKREKEEEKVLSEKDRIRESKARSDERFKVKRIKRIYPDHKVDIEWKREVAET